MKLVDKLVQKLALRWLRGWLGRARKGDNAVMKLLDGNKRLLIVLGFIASGLVAMLTGHDVGQWLDLLLRAFGWQDAAAIAEAQAVATQVVPLLFAIWAAASSLWKMRKQWKAGATLVELNSTRGYVKAALADGEILASDSGPVLKG